MKHGDINGTVGHFSLLFPGEYARASLKHMTPLSRTRPEPPIPGRICPGLIEAAPKPWACRSRSIGLFPGEYARASLKHRWRDLGKWNGRHLFPGRICPGLIEALCPAGARSVCSSLFPGEYARASLKRAGPQSAWRADDHLFPGEYARASLKLGIAAPNRARWLARYSRANMPGPH